MGEKKNPSTKTGNAGYMRLLSEETVHPEGAHFWEIYTEDTPLLLVFFVIGTQPIDKLDTSRLMRI